MTGATILKGEKKLLMSEGQLGVRGSKFFTAVWGTGVSYPHWQTEDEGNVMH